MCTNRHEITLRSGRKMFVDCGECPACQQAKANKRAQRIRYNDKNDYVTLFVTLTYDNKYIPYIKKSDFPLYGSCSVPVYRDYDVRRVRSFSYRLHKRNKDRLVKDKVVYRDVDRPVGIFDSVDFDLSYKNPSNIDLVERFKTIRYKKNFQTVFHNDKVGILYYPDIQNFFKRLLINYERAYDKKLETSFFYCGEYGAKYARPHYHALIQCKKEDEQRVRDTILKSWRFSDRRLLQQYIEVAYAASGYVAAYVNTSTYLSPVYFQKSIRPKSCHSKFYGFGHPDHQLGKILEMFHRGTFEHTILVPTKKALVARSVLLPRYVLSKYFPKIKGFSKLTSEELASICCNPQKLNFYAKRLGYDSHVSDKNNTSFWSRFNEFSFNSPCDENGKENEPLELVYLKTDLWREKRSEFIRQEYSSVKDLVRNVRALFNARNRFCYDYKMTYGSYPHWSLYAFYYTRVWFLYASEQLRYMYNDIPEQDRFLTLDNVNNNEYDLKRHNELLLLYSTYDKMKKHNNIAASQRSFNF